MKTIKYLTLRLMAVAAIAIAFALPAKAQVTPFTYFNVDWQFNAPISNNFANKASGWGMNFEGGYYILPDLSIGAFINYHTNNEYISRQTLPISNSAALTTDQQHSVFQLPFGFATHYRFSDGACQPYIGLKLGANYTKMSSDFYIYEVKDNTWGFYVSPEVGVNIYPWTNSIGFHLAAFYSYSTNKGTVTHVWSRPSSTREVSGETRARTRSVQVFQRLSFGNRLAVDDNRRRERKFLPFQKRSRQSRLGTAKKRHYEH